MELREPVIITPRLLAGVRVGDAFISIDYDCETSEGRTQYRYFVDLPNGGGEFEGTDLRSGCQGGDLREGLESLLTFLGACGEAVNYQEQTGQESENADLFPAAVAR